MPSGSTISQTKKQLEETAKHLGIKNVAHKTKQQLSVEIMDKTLTRLSRRWPTRRQGQRVAVMTEV